MIRAHTILQLCICRDDNVMLSESLPDIVDPYMAVLNSEMERVHESGSFPANSSVPGSPRMSPPRSPVSEVWHRFTAMGLLSPVAVSRGRPALYQGIAPL